jgi:hypothetical protein
LLVVLLDANDKVLFIRWLSMLFTHVLLLLLLLLQIWEARL